MRMVVISSSHSLHTIWMHSFLIRGCSLFMRCALVLCTCLVLPRLLSIGRRRTLSISWRRISLMSWMRIMKKQRSFDNSSARLLDYLTPPFFHFGLSLFLVSLCRSKYWQCFSPLSTKSCAILQYWVDSTSSWVLLRSFPTSCGPQKTNTCLTRSCRYQPLLPRAQHATSCTVSSSIHFNYQRNPLPFDVVIFQPSILSFPPVAIVPYVSPYFD